MNSVEYQLTIKSANQKVDDYSLNCRSSWTVLRLKQHISETHVNKPNIKDQRLIYAGNLLKDSLTLKQVFFRDSLCTELTNSNKTDFTIHLVCSNSSQKTSLATSSGLGPSGNLTATTHASQPISARTDPSSSSSTTTTTVTPPSTSVNTNGTSHANIHSSNLADNSTSQAPATNMSAGQVPGIVTDLLQSEQMRQQLATLQQLANMVAAELAQNLAINLNIQPGPSRTDTSAQVPFQLSALSGLLNPDQSANMPTITTTSPTNLAYTDNGQAANSIATQLLYAGQSNRNGHGLTGDTNVNNPGVGHQPDGNQFGFNPPAQTQAHAQAAVAAAQQQQVEAPPAPIIEQPVHAQPVDPEPILQHDVIDWVYYSIRAIVLMTALYIHASLFRLLFIFGLLAIALYFNRRSARRQNQPVARPNAAQPPQAVPANQQEVANDAPLQQAGELRRRFNGDEPADGDNNQNDDNVAEQVRPLENTNGEDVAQRRVSFFKLCYLVVADFLASLVPE